MPAAVTGSEGADRVLVNTLVSNDAEGGRVFVARPRNISGPAEQGGGRIDEDEQSDTVLTARPREINGVDFKAIGPKGLSLPEWHPSMAPDRARLEAEAERRAQRQSIFGATEYWNAYYSDPGSAGTEYTEEWYCSAAELAKLLPSPASQGDSALVLGCGLSTLGDALHAAGWRVTALDVSPVLVAHLQTRGGPCAPLLGDARHLPCADGAFGLVVDKATIDTVRCGVASEAGAREAYAEACRVLSPGGRLVSVSHSSRASALGAQGLPWSVQESEVACAAAPDAAAEAIDAQRRQLAKQLARLAARLAPPARHALMACARDALPAAGAPGGAAAVERLELLIADLAEESGGGRGVAVPVLAALQRLVRIRGNENLGPSGTFQNVPSDGGAPAEGSTCWVCVCKKRAAAPPGAPGAGPAGAGGAAVLAGGGDSGGLAAAMAHTESKMEAMLREGDAAGGGGGDVMRLLGEMLPRPGAPAGDAGLPSEMARAGGPIMSGGGGSEGLGRAMVHFEATLGQIEREHSSVGSGGSEMINILRGMVADDAGVREKQ